MKGVTVKFDSKKWQEALFKQLSLEQTTRLIAYAKEQTQSIGDDISVAPTTNNLDRTGNLLDSLCWGVYHNGGQKGSGYYRKESATEDAYLHEFSNPKGMLVNGHALAQNFIATYTPTTTNGWEVFFAMLAPYWGYWEKGFTMPRTGLKFQWQVMTHHWDEVKRDLHPSRVTFNNYIPS